VSNDKPSIFRGNPLEGCRNDARRLVEILETLQSSNPGLLAECRETARRLKTELGRKEWESHYPGYPFAK
jgi:hypothetical protein